MMENISSSHRATDPTVLVDVTSILVFMDMTTHGPNRSIWESPSIQMDMIIVRMCRRMVNTSSSPVFEKLNP